jgi:hypothetical protein
MEAETGDEPTHPADRQKVDLIIHLARKKRVSQTAPSPGAASSEVFSTVRIWVFGDSHPQFPA